MWFWATNLLIYVAFLASLTSFIANYHQSRIVHTHIYNSSDNTTTQQDHWSVHRFSFNEVN